MEKWYNAGETIIDLEVPEVKLLTVKLAHLFEGERFKIGSELEVESVLFSMFPELKSAGLYLAKSHNLVSSFHFHPIVGKKIETPKYLYHLTKDIDSVLREGLKGFSCSQDGVRFSEKRIYFSVKPFSEIIGIDDASYMSSRKEIRIETSPEMEVYLDPEYLEESGMVYVIANHIPVEKISSTGFESFWTVEK